MELEKAEKLANQFIKMVERYCDRIEIAGSIRRKKPEVKDIEIVCVPQRFKVLKTTQSHLDRILEHLEKRNRIRFIKRGQRLKNFYLIRKDKTIIIKVDMFCVLPPAQWGVIFMLRTGPTSFNKWLVTYRKPKGLKFKDGSIHRKIEQVGKVKPLWIKESTPEEMDVFNVLEIDYIGVKDREDY